MNLENFFAAQIYPPGKTQGQAAVFSTLQTSKQQVQGFDTDGFMELILMYLNDKQKNEDIGAKLKEIKNHDALKSESPVLNDDADLNITELLAANPDIKEEIRNLAETFSLDLNQQIATVLTLNQQAFMEDLKPLSTAEIYAALTARRDESSTKAPDLFEILARLDNAEEEAGDQNTLESILAKIKAVHESGNPAPLLSGLTPSDIARLEEALAAGAPIAVTQNDQGEISFIDPSQISEDGQAKAAVGLPASLGLLLVRLTAASPSAPDRIPGQNVTGQTLPANDEALIRHQAGNLTPLARPAGGFSFDDLMTQINGFEQNLNQGNGALKNSAKAMLNGLKTGLENAGAGAGSAGKDLPGLPALGSLLQNWSFGRSGSLLSPAGWNQTPIDELGLYNAGMGSGTPGSLTSVLTQAQSAAHSHPATAMVAATLRKAASTGQTQNMTLTLEPPELGRVEVRMQFNAKEKTMQARIIAEKPETVLLLQRDAHILERSLQGLGLDADSGLSFELANDENGFGQDGSRDGHHGGSQGDEAGDDELDVIESTMMWQVDPETGHMRYSILA